ncbi:MAG: hypothetical protein Kow0090_01400 [Myxococcota bacterium]
MRKKIFKISLFLAIAASLLGGCDRISKFIFGEGTKGAASPASTVLPALSGALFCTADNWCQDSAIMETEGYRGGAFLSRRNEYVILSGRRSLLRREGGNYRIEPLILPELNSIYSIWSGAEGEIYAAGEGIFRESGKEWAVERKKEGRDFYAIESVDGDIAAVGEGGLFAVKSGGEWRELNSSPVTDWRALYTRGDKMIAGGSDGFVGVYEGKKWNFTDTKAIQDDDILAYGSKGLFAALEALQSNRMAELIDLDTIFRLSLIGDSYDIAAVWIDEKGRKCFITEWGLEYCLQLKGWELANKALVSRCGISVNGFIDLRQPANCPAGRITGAGYYGGGRKLVTVNTSAFHYEVYDCGVEGCEKLKLPSSHRTRYIQKPDKPLVLLNGHRVALFLPNEAEKLQWLDNMSITPPPKDFIGARKHKARIVAVASDGSVFKLKRGRFIQFIQPIPDLEAELSQLVQTTTGEVLAVGEKIFQLKKDSWRELTIPGVPQGGSHPYMYPFQGSQTNGLVAVIGRNEGLFWEQRTESLLRRELFNLEDENLSELFPDKVPDFRILKVTQTSDGRVYILFDLWKGYYGDAERMVIEAFGGRARLKKWRLRNIFAAADGSLVRMTAQMIYPLTGEGARMVTAPDWLYSCFASSGDEIYCLSNDSKVLHYKGGEWDVQDVGVGYDGIDARISDIWGDTRGNLYIAAYNGVLRYRKAEEKR